MEKNMAVGDPPLPWRLTNPAEPGFLFNPPETPFEPMEFLSRSWSFSALQVSKALAPPSKSTMSGPVSDAKVEHETILEDVVGESAVDDPKDPVVSSSTVSGYPFSFASWEASTQLMVDRIMSQSQEVSPRTSARSSHSSGPLVGSSLPDISSVPPYEIDDIKYCYLNNNTSATTAGRRMMKERKEKRKEETRPPNAQLRAAVSVAGVAAAVAAIAAASSSSRSTKDRELDWTDMAVASAATLVAAQCVEAAESIGAEREHLASVVSSAVNVRSADNIMTLTSAAATALRGAESVKARALKEVSSVANVLPMEKGMVSGGKGGNRSIGSHSNELVLEQNFPGVCSRKLLARGCELLKRTRKGELHWKIVSIYINRMNQVTLKMKSRHVAGTLTKKKKYVVLEVVKGMPAWAGRYLLEGGENRRYFGLKTGDRGLIEFECRSQREYEAWTEGVSRLLSLAAERSKSSNKCRM